jgi:iron complex outermembrane receptor protein
LKGNSTDERDNYFTFDWRTVWTPNKKMALTLGALDVLNTAPPLSISTGGSNRGQQFGDVDRYYGPRGRTIYMNASYKFIVWWQSGWLWLR